MDRQFHFIVENYQHMSSVSGMFGLFEAFEIELGNRVKFIDIGKVDVIKPTRFNRVLTYLRLKEPILGHEKLSPHTLLVHNYAARKAIKQLNSNQQDIVVLSDLENQFTVSLSTVTKNLKNRIVGISHQHPAWYKLNGFDLNTLNGLRKLFVFSDEQKVFFEKHLDVPVVKIDHGVNLDFFKPSQSKRSNDAILFVGAWQRDFQLLSDIILKYRSLDNTITFRLVIPVKSRTPDFYKLAKEKGVYFYHGLTPEGLRNLYCESCCVLLPLLTATANNTLLEAIATETPVVVSESPETRYYSENIWNGIIPVNSNIDSFIFELENIVSKKREIEPMNRDNLRCFEWKNITTQIIQEIDG